MNIQEAVQRHMARDPQRREAYERAKAASGKGNAMIPVDLLPILYLGMRRYWTSHEGPQSWDDKNVAIVVLRCALDPEVAAHLETITALDDLYYQEYQDAEKAEKAEKEAALTKGGQVG